MTSALSQSLTKEAWNRADNRLANGVGSGSLARIYRQHQLRFARVLEVDTSLGLTPNVKVQYLDWAEEDAQVYGSQVQPLTRGWIEDMKDRFDDIASMFDSEPGQPIIKNTPAKLKNGATAGSLVRIYKNHSLRFARVLAVKQSFPTQPNVEIQYFDNDRERARVFGSVVVPVDAGWVDALRQRLAIAETHLVARRQAQQG